MYNPDNFPVYLGYELDSLDVLKTAGKMSVTISKKARKEIEKICAQKPLSEGEFVDIASVVVACADKPIDLKALITLLLDASEVVTTCDIERAGKIIGLSADVFKNEFNCDNIVNVPSVSRGFAIYGCEN